MEKKKALRKAAVSKPKGNGINDGYVQWACPACALAAAGRVYAVVFWQLLMHHETITAATFAAFLSIDFTKDNMLKVSRIISLHLQFSKAIIFMYSGIGLYERATEWKHGMKEQTNDAEYHNHLISHSCCNQ